MRWKTLLGFSCRNRLLLSGTPIQNSMAELWALLHFIMPTLFDSHEEFNEWFSKDIESHAENKTGIDESNYQLTTNSCILTPNSCPHPPSFFYTPLVSMGLLFNMKTSITFVRHNLWKGRSAFRHITTFFFYLCLIWKKYQNVQVKVGKRLNNKTTLPYVSLLLLLLLII